MISGSIKPCSCKVPLFRPLFEGNELEFQETVTQAGDLMHSARNISEPVFGRLHVDRFGL